MKIALPSTGDGLDSQVSMIFGRCPKFVIVEVEDGKIKSDKTIENTGVSQRGGAGITAGQLIGNQDAKTVITGAMGPRAFEIMNQLGMKVYSAVQGTVRENVEKFIKGELEELTTPGPMGRGMGPGAGRGPGAGGHGKGPGRGPGRPGRPGRGSGSGGGPSRLD